MGHVSVSAKAISRRRLLGGALVVAAGSLVAACQQPAAAPSPTAPAAAGAPTAAATTAAAGAAAPAQTAAPSAGGISIKYQQRSNQVEDFVRKKYGPQFEKETGIKVIIEDIPDAEYFQKIPVLAAAQQLGDLVFSWTFPWLPPLAYKQMLRAIDDYVAQDKYDLGQFYKGSIDASRFEGKLYGLPTIGHALYTNIYFNRTLMQKAGVTPPDSKSPNEVWKWDDLLKAAQALATVGSDGKVAVWGFLPTRDFMPATVSDLRMFGTDILTADGRSCTVGDDLGKQSYRYWYDLIYKAKVAPAPTDLVQGVGLAQFFASGKLAMFQEATAPVTTTGPVVGDKFEWGVFILPKGPGGTSRGAGTFGNVTAITSQAKQPEAAWKFLQYITTHEVGVQKVLMGSGSPGARPDVYQDPRLTQPYPWYKVGHIVMEEATAPIIPWNVRTTEIQTAVPQLEDEIWLNKINPEDGAVKIQQAINDILKQPK